MPVYGFSVLRVGSIVIRVDDLARQTAFWSAALDYEPRTGADDDFVLLKPPRWRRTERLARPGPLTVQVPPRIHLDLYAEDQAGEVGASSASARPRSTGTSGRPTRTT